MRGLLVKDWELAKQQKKYFLTIFLIGVVLNLGSSEGFASGYFIMLMTFFIITTISYDEFDNGMLFLMSFPIKRKTYVTEKYVAALIAAVGSGIIGTVCSCLISMVAQHGKDLSNLVITAIMIIPLAMFLFGITMPFIMKFGVEKGRFLPLGFVAVFVALGAVIAKFSDGAADSVGGSLEVLNSVNEYVVIGIMYLVVAVICLICYFISVKIIEKKEW